MYHGHGTYDTLKSHYVTKVCKTKTKDRGLTSFFYVYSYFNLSEKRENTKGPGTVNLCGRYPATTPANQGDEVFTSARPEGIQMKAGPQQNLLYR